MTIIIIVINITGSSKSFGVGVMIHKKKPYKAPSIMTTVMPPFANASLKNNTIAHCFGLDRHTFCIFGYPFEGGYATIIICVIRTCLHKEFLFLKSASS